METAEIIQIDGGQAVKLPNEIHFDGDFVSIRREGAIVILEPIGPRDTLAAIWPADFFESIHIDDPSFARPEQGKMPPTPSFD